MELDLVPRTYALRAPLRSAHGDVAERNLLEVRLRDADGTVGTGEAAPLPSYDGVGLEQVAGELAALRPALRAADGGTRADLVALAREGCTLPQARSAIDLAAWDLEGRRAGRAVARLLSADPAARIAVNATIGATGPAQAAAAAAAARNAGYRCVKVKVGVTGDVDRVAAVRGAVGPDVAIRVDANGAWDVAAAVAGLRALAPFDIELCEEPVHGVAALREVREGSLGIPIAMDETGVSLAAVASGATDLVCLKLTRCGGVSGVLEAARAAREGGSDVYLASTLDGPAGIAAALHAAAAIRPDVPCGLATLGMFEGLTDPAPDTAGTVAVPDGPGLGV